MVVLCPLQYRRDEAPYQCPLEVALYYYPFYADVRYIDDVTTFLRYSMV